MRDERYTDMSKVKVSASHNENECSWRGPAGCELAEQRSCGLAGRSYLTLQAALLVYAHRCSLSHSNKKKMNSSVFTITCAYS